MSCELRFCFFQFFGWIDGDAFAARPPARVAVDGRRPCRCFLNAAGDGGAEVMVSPVASSGDVTYPAFGCGGCDVWKL